MKDLSIEAFSELSLFLRDLNKPASTSSSELYFSFFETFLGMMIAVASSDHLYLLDFVESRRVKKKLVLLQKKMKTRWLNQSTPLIQSLEEELNDYFSGEKKSFSIPYRTIGTPFQEKVWKQLICIPYGETVCYQQQALLVGDPLSSRAVANANGANLLSIIIPCHRVVRKSGGLGGYAGGTARKKWLYEHEKRNR